MRIAIIQFPGSNCERETILAVKRAGMTPVEFLWNEPAEKLMDMDGYIIVGGFSWEDRSRAGIIAALHPVMQVLKIQGQAGKPILGICNGAQILLEAGLVPGNQDAIALTNNKRMQDGQVLGTGYYNAWIHIKAHPHSQSLFAKSLTQNKKLRIPVAHGEGRFLTDAKTLARLEAAGCIAFQYCNTEGLVENIFPTNPNGSMANIAALSNPEGNILAIMPHPERTPEADCLLQAMRDYLESGYKPFNKLPLKKTKPEILPLSHNPHTYTMLVELIIADNEALAVQNALREKGLKVTIKRHIYWEVACASKSIFHQIQASGVLYNERKSFLASYEPKDNQRSFLVKPKENLQGLQKKQQLMNHFAIDGLTDIQQGVLWHIEADAQELDIIVEQILDTSILFNAISHVCYHYD